MNEHIGESKAEDDAEKTEYLTFRKIAEGKDNPYIAKYLDSSKETYDRHGINFEEIEISPDFAKAKMEFSADASMQANEGIVHGGLTEYNVDSVTAALVLARIEKDHIPLTIGSSIKYTAPCNVGGRYVIGVEFDNGRGRKETYKFTVKDASDGHICAEGNIEYFSKKV